jgi:hypothetical protein
VFFRIEKTMHGLKEAGKLSNLRLSVCLRLSVSSKPLLLVSSVIYVSRPISFVLIVDDFGVKYHSKVDFDYLVSCLTTLYQVKSHPIGTKFLGFTIKHDRIPGTLVVSYPGYVTSLLHAYALMDPPTGPGLPSSLLVLTPLPQPPQTN